MEALCGKWKTGALPANLEDYVKAVGLMDKIDMFKKPHVFDISISGDTVTSIQTIEGVGSHTNVGKLGEKVKANLPPFGECETILTVKGDELISEQDFGTFKQTMTSRVENGQLVLTTTAKGVTITGKLNKI